jgi:hypothetical protein
MYDLVATDDSALIIYLCEAGIVDPCVPIKNPVTAADVIGKHVIGKLPHSLSCVALSYTEIPVHLPPYLEGVTPIIKDYEKYAGDPVTYKVERVYRYPGEVKNDYAILR